jgi:hypothetical protein
MNKLLKIFLFVACLAALALIVYSHTIQFGWLIPTAVTVVIAMAVIAIYIRFAP